MARRWPFRLIMVVLALSITSVVFVAWAPFLGLDFQNLDAFHDCAARDNPYLGSGDACGDYLGRDMYYPPLLYWSFAWTRLLSFETGYLIWATVVIVGSAAALAAWVPSARRGGPMLVFGGALLLTLPMVFAVERGNNDAIVLVLWTASAWSLMSRRPGWAGSIAGLAVLFKLYPAFAVIVVLAGLLAAPRVGGWRRWPLVRYSMGGLIVAIIAGLPLLDQSLDFARTTLPAMMAWHPGATLGQHSLIYIAPGGHA